MGNIIKGYPQVSRSITNPNVNRDDALDKFAPFSFLTFIKNVEESFAPDTLQDFYTAYINRWSKISTKKTLGNNELIIERYKDFLKDIALNFSTNAEKKFLTQIDFNDKNDLRIVISYYSKKIRDIITYYNKKRNSLHFSAIKSKVKGTNINLQQTARELILDFLENTNTGNIDYNIDAIKNNLSVSLTEYFDNYSQYFNRAPTKNAYGRNQKGYDNASDIFVTPDVDLIERTYGAVSNELTALKEGNQLFETKRKQTKKYIGADYYYLRTDSAGTPTVGILFEAEAPYRNLIDQNFPTTASVFSDDIISERDLGFFKPTNTSIVSIQGQRLEYFEKESYKPNQFYIFPDPNLFTNNHDIFAFVVDTALSQNNESKGIAANQPNTDKNSTSVIGYNSEILQDRNINTDLSFLYDQGYISDSKKDLFGNIFGLVKDNSYYKEEFINETPTTIKSLIFNGYQFFDDLYGDGYNFNYSVTDSTTFPETLRSGISSFTNGMTGKGEGTINSDTPANWTSFPTSAYNIFFRYFNPYQELLAPSNFKKVDYNIERTITADVKEGAYFKFTDSDALASTLRSGLCSYTASFEDGTGSYYFTELIEGGVAQYNGLPSGDGNKSTIVRALCDADYPTISGNMTLNVRASGGPDSNNGVQNMDGGLFTDNIVYNYGSDVEDFTYIDTVYLPTETLSVTPEKESYFNKNEHLGKVYLKNISIAPSLSPVKELTQALPYLSTKYNTTICNELCTKVTNFDIYNGDTLFIETSSNLVIEKTVYDDGAFVNPNTTAISLSHSSDNFNKLSNRVTVNNEVFYCRLVHSQIENLCSFRVYPEIRKYNNKDKVNERIFPTTINPVVSSSTYFTNTASNVTYIESSKPFLTYSSANQLFNLGFLLKDQNKTPVLYNYLFEYNDNVSFLSTDYYETTDNNFTNLYVNNTGDLDLESLSFSLCGNNPLSAGAVSLVL